MGSKRFWKYSFEKHYLWCKCLFNLWIQTKYNPNERTRLLIWKKQIIKRLNDKIRITWLPDTCDVSISKIGINNKNYANIKSRNYKSNFQVLKFHNQKELYYSDPFFSNSQTWKTLLFRPFFSSAFRIGWHDRIVERPCICRAVGAWGRGGAELRSFGF